MTIDPSHVLASAPADTPLRVLSVLFDAVRAHCAERGVLVGASVRRVAATAEYLVLEVPERGRVRLDRALSAFIEVEPVAHDDRSLAGEH